MKWAIAGSVTVRSAPLLAQWQYEVGCCWLSNVLYVGDRIIFRSIMSVKYFRVSKGQIKVNHQMLSCLQNSDSGDGTSKGLLEMSQLRTVRCLSEVLFQHWLGSTDMNHEDWQEKINVLLHAQCVSNALGQPVYECQQWHTQEFCSGGSTNSVEDRGQTERGSGGGSPLVRGSGGRCNLVQEISFHIVKFS